MDITLDTLQPFQDTLPTPPVLRPKKTDDNEDCVNVLQICLRNVKVKLHAQLPETGLWSYQGSIPGPTIEVNRGEKVRVDWINHLQGHVPYRAFIATTGSAEPPQNDAGPSGGVPQPNLDSVTPWTVVHLHGAKTEADSDGWPENAAFPNQSQLVQYTNNQNSAMLWYHDHAMATTRLNVYAGLSGLWIIRDAEERALGLVPKSDEAEFEIPLVIQDRNLDTEANGKLNGALVYKVETDVMEFFGPVTLVNGKIWPFKEVEARQYRLRVLNASNARVYRLVLIDDNGTPCNSMIKQIGTDQGLLGAPVSFANDEGIILAPAERADLIINFANFKGKNLRWVNTATAPYNGNDPPVVPGVSDAMNRLKYPNVMQFRVSNKPVTDKFTLPASLAKSYTRITHDNFQHKQHRLIALVEDTINNMLFLNELIELGLGKNPPLNQPVFELKNKDGTLSRYYTGAHLFPDMINWFAESGSNEVWRFLNLTGDTHPIHIHLVKFQALSRQVFDVTDTSTHYDPLSGYLDTVGKPPVSYVADGTLDANERGWKDNIRVNPGEIVSVGMNFAEYTGRYVYHCHILEHEDAGMMRPFVVLPANILMFMGMDGMHM
ncbi:MAG: multicopper oxidase domain-containing protein [Gammaproteobacteria bacterium]|nr:multicopper oxidase domain-containing protein [Gammaproteobacteria bacterium]